MRIIYLYKITNTINQKIYIGQSVNPRARWYAHKKEAERDSPRSVISRAIRKYDSTTFVFELIVCCKSFDNANFIETELISQYHSTDSSIGYNVSLGGMNAPKTEEWKRKVSEKLMGHEVSQETRDKVSKGNAGKIRSEEFKKNASDLQRGKERTEEHCRNLSESLKGNQNCSGKQNSLGYKHTDEAKDKISKASKSQVKRYKGKTWKVINGKRVWIMDSIGITDS